MLFVHCLHLQKQKHDLAFKYLVFTCMAGESYRRQLRFVWLCSCDVFGALSNFPCLLIQHKPSMPRSVSDRYREYIVALVPNWYDLHGC